MTKYPQITINVRVSPEGKAALASDAEIAARAEAARRALGTSGRIILRASGTEPLIRIMAEGKDSEQITALATSLAEFIEKRLK